MEASSRAIPDSSCFVNNNFLSYSERRRERGRGLLLRLRDIYFSSLFLFFCLLWLSLESAEDVTSVAGRGGTAQRVDLVHSLQGGTQHCRLLYGLT